MANNARYVGAYVIEIDGVDIEAMDWKCNIVTGRKPVITMNREARLKGYAKGVAQHEISFTVPVLVNEDSRQYWEDINTGKITIYPIERPDRRTSFRGFFSTNVDETTSAESEASLSIQGYALGKINE